MLVQDVTGKKNRVATLEVVYSYSGGNLKNDLKQAGAQVWKVGASYSRPGKVK